MPKRFLALAAACGLCGLIASFPACSSDAPPDAAKDGGVVGEGGEDPDRVNPCGLGGGAVGPNSPNKGENVVLGSGPAWQGPIEILVADSKFVRAPLQPGQTTQELIATEFDFRIPTEANIKGIVVAIRRAASYGGIVDESVRLTVGKTRSKTNRAATKTPWPVFAATAEYGGPEELWGEGWLPQEVNDTSFGVSIVARAEPTAIVDASVPDGGGLEAQVDHVGITVFYELCR